MIQIFLSIWCSVLLLLTYSFPFFPPIFHPCLSCVICADENGKDQGINIRQKVKEMVEFAQDDDRLREERKKAKKNKDKYIGVSSDSVGGFRYSEYWAALGKDWNPLLLSQIIWIGVLKYICGFCACFLGSVRSDFKYRHQCFSLLPVPAMVCSRELALGLPSDVPSLPSMIQLPVCVFCGQSKSLAAFSKGWVPKSQWHKALVR